MWYATENALRHEDGDSSFSFPVFFPDWSKFSGECLTLERSYHDFLGYDDWVQQYCREDEILLTQNTIASLKNHPRRVHIAWISARESIECLREYYRELWYEDALAKNYILPNDTLLTVSVSLRHILWCEKDKVFLEKKDPQHTPYYAFVPPLRSPADLRALQQGARMGIIMGVEVFPGDEAYIPDILSREILTPFQIAQLLSFRWNRYGFSGTQKMYSLQFPDFPWEGEDLSS